MGASQPEMLPFDRWTRRRFGLAAGGALTALLSLTKQPEADAKMYGHGHHHHGHNHDHHHGNGRVKGNQQAKAQLEPVNGSGISGFVVLHQRKKGQGTSIEVHATGLTPGTEYLSLYYENDVCDLEPDSLEDQIGPRYFPNPAGNGKTHGSADEDLDEIGSVSVRLTTSELTLQACAKIH